ncbi:hypothetical protein N6H14_14955 [Paenibacillus sp. CC-CFT747]|nr:hypothetical protein N6H14_14955 [Paenibacillus sp. CC-CFT747]
MKIDRAAPVTTAVVSGTAGSEGWYVSVPTVTLNAEDPLSGVQKTEYRVSRSGDDAHWSDWIPYTGPFQLEEGRNVVAFRSLDLAGNTEQEQTAQVAFDAHAPTFEVLANGTVLTTGTDWSDSDLLQLAVQAADTLSGVASTQITVTDSVYGAIAENGGLYDLAGRLGPVKVHVTVTDHAGNRAEAEYTLNVTTNYDSVLRLLARYESAGEVAKPLSEQLQAAIRQAKQMEDDGKPKQALKHLEDFVKHLQNDAMQKFISNQAKQALASDANELLKRLQP